MKKQPDSNLVMGLSVFSPKKFMNDLDLFVCCSSPYSAINSGKAAVKLTLESSTYVQLDRLGWNANR